MLLEGFEQHLHHFTPAMTMQFNPRHRLNPTHDEHGVIAQRCPEQTENEALDGPLLGSVGKRSAARREERAADGPATGSMYGERRNAACAGRRQTGDDGVTHVSPPRWRGYPQEFATAR